jgi:hypothetical protein
MASPSGTVAHGMMRNAAAFLLLLPAPTAVLADTPTETVVVDASTLTGVWKIAKPSYVQKEGFFGALKWGPLQEQYCRIGQQGGLTLNCLPGPKDGAVTIEGTHIHLAWGTMMARLALDGTLQSSNHFQATYEIKLAGVSFTDSEKSTGVKLSIAPTARDKNAEAALLRTILTDGMAGVPHDDAAIQKAAPTSGDMQKLGAIQDIAYLGQQAPLAGPPGAKQDKVDYFSVYAVEFESGERICGLHQQADGVLDAFLCL